jgi:hypothetical protein
VSWPWGSTRGHVDLLEDVQRRWRKGPGKTAGDLGVLIMHELALSYAAAHRKLYDWLEQWELQLYLSENAEREPIGVIWGSMALMRNWIKPLNPPGLRTDINNAWFSDATDHVEVVAVDERIDKALKALSELGQGDSHLLWTAP